MSSICRISILVISFALAFSPATGLAQTDVAQNAQLREEFRTALVEDSRTSSLSEAELSTMLDALVEQAESQDAVSDFILPPLPEAAPETAADFTYTLVTPWGQPVTPEVLYGVILFCLLCAISLLWLLLHLHKHADLRVEA